MCLSETGDGDGESSLQAGSESIRPSVQSAEMCLRWVMFLFIVLFFSQASRMIKESVIAPALEPFFLLLRAKGLSIKKCVLPAAIAQLFIAIS